MCDDVKAFIADMKKRGIDCGPVQSPGWGVLTHVMLPGGGKLGVYEPRHARPKPMKVGKPAKKEVKKRPPTKRSGGPVSRRRAVRR